MNTDIIYNSNSTEAEVPTGITTIEASMFKKNAKLIKVSMPKSVTSIEDTAFYGCLSLSDIVFPQSLKSIGAQAFCYTKLGTVDCPSSLEQIGDFAFSSCKKLSSVNIADSTKTIGAGAFGKCTQLSEVHLPASLETIESQTFGGCASLQKIVIPDKVETIGNSAFQASGLASIVLPPSVKKIGSLAFAYCENLVEVKVFRDTAIAKDAFEGSDDVRISKYDTIEAMRQSPLDELKKLIGLQNVKKEVEELHNFLIIQQKRKESGMYTSRPSYHCVFTGNPGTGKTTVARIIAGVYKEMGVIKRGQLIETDRSGLVGDRPGQTAIKTNTVIDSALDGILFIDEAYSLIQGDDSYGVEAISTLLKRMEDDRDRLVVILAGYSKEMKQFIDTNPGLQSRFTRYIDFADYNEDELYRIFLGLANKFQYKLTDFASDFLKLRLEYIVEHKDQNFGNGRTVRNLFEKTLQNQSVRLTKKLDLNDDDLKIISHEDFYVCKY